MKRSITHLEETPGSLCITKKAKYKCIKWVSDLELDQNDKYALQNLHQIINESPSSIQSDIAKNIAEYALGCIRICPGCENCELLITPSRLIDTCFVFQHKQKFESLKCPSCLTDIFIHICDNHAVHDKTAMITNGHCNWWLYWAPRDDIDSRPLPQTHICKSCLMECIILHSGWQDYPQHFKPLCDECRFQCSLCKNIFCNNLHIGYYCSICDSIYCEMCQDYSLSKGINSCINCFYDLQKYALYYPNLQDRLLFHHYFGSLFHDHEYGLNIFFPLKIIHYIVAFINGNIINCSKPECIEDISIVTSTFNYHQHNHAPYIDQIVTCRLGHRNYIHPCSKCHELKIANELSCISYIIHSMPLPNGINILYTKSNFIQNNKLYSDPQDTCCECITYCNKMHKSGLRHEYLQTTKLNKVCNQCSSVCSDFRCSKPRLVCDTHSYSQCTFCGNIYCHEHLFNFIHYQADGDLFDKELCCHCWDIFDAIRDSFFEEISFKIVDIIIFYVWNYRTN